MNERTEIINDLIKENGYTSYLEIGVYDGVNFRAVNCKNKISVDPDPKCKATFRITSDQYFASPRKHDIIFIDGLHHSDQVLRDINSALACLPTNGTIVVHDCNPTDEGMQIVPRQQGEWTGDVWKAWQELRATRADLKMFVYDIDYGVGIIQKGEQKPPFTLARTYGEFNQHRTEILNLIPYGQRVPLSICIPAFEQYGHGERTLAELLQSLAPQVGNREVIVSDNGNTLRSVCNKFPFVTYYHNPDRGISANTNFAISKATHPHIKIMYQDDIALPGMVDAFSKALAQHDWVIAAGHALDAKGRRTRDTKPRWTENIIRGKNTIGMPSVTGFRNPDFDFDINLKTLLDCEYYWRLHKAYGSPYIINRPLIGSRYWEGSTSRRQGNLTETEWLYLQDKWEELQTA